MKLVCHRVRNRASKGLSSVVLFGHWSWVGQMGRRSESDGTSGRPSSRLLWWVKRGLLVVCVIYVSVPFMMRLFPDIIKHLVYSHRVRVPFFVNLSQPADLYLNHTVNMYLKSEQGISLGVWHTVPESQWKEAQGKDLEWYQDSLGAGIPIIIYLHGNGGTRAASHRVGLVRVLSAIGYHVLALDYRGFGDSTGEPTEVGLTTDTLYLYQWVKARSGSSLVVLWGQSLGTGLKRMRSRLLILHAEDDHIVPIHMAQQLYEIAQSAQNSENQVKMIPFSGSLGYHHNGLYKDPHLPDIIREFVHTLAP
ncbi:lysophosphatidylserine lipase ABHD12-like isoform X3 [Oncorhynchus nerka]|uniref:lysophosphatidylserine lipase ABHD12-like isoform X3 n=1 Tax=Oncorhynchus nerka TaxID=8023 RepID=UPI001131F5DE|nr:lysophosphatidylserine lipase ABHD12-like isoform X3 [Oncorhynchus nerka]